MTITDIFSKRQKRLRGEVPDVYTYDTFPDSFRVQIVHIWRDCLGNEEAYRFDCGKVRDGYKLIVDILCREYGVFKLIGHGLTERHYMGELIDFFLQEQEPERIVDVIEISFRFADMFARGYDHWQKRNASEIVDTALKELNARLKEHGIGFQFEEGDMIRVDSQLIHAEVVKPALKLLSNKEYAGAQQEFLNAYEHYRHGNYKEALNEALKSFESTLKTICTKKGWAIDVQTDTSKKLLDVCYTNGLIPAFWQGHMSALRSLLEGGVPTGRNKLSGHGQGSVPTKVPEHIVSYILHMTASAIVFLVKAEQFMN